MASLSPLRLLLPQAKSHVAGVAPASNSGPATERPAIATGGLRRDDWQPMLPRHAARAASTLHSSRAVPSLHHVQEPVLVLALPLLLQARPGPPASYVRACAPLYASSTSSRPCPRRQASVLAVFSCSLAPAPPVPAGLRATLPVPALPPAPRAAPGTAQVASPRAPPSLPSACSGRAAASPQLLYRYLA